MSPRHPHGPLVVVGDTLLDLDLDGRATRLAPDAPVPVLEDLTETPRPGGAGLAAALAARAGHEVVLVTALGDDEAGARVEGLLDGVRVVRLPYDGPTPVKRRVRARGRALLRLDTGTAPGAVCRGGLTGRARAAAEDALATAGSVLVADYGRGVPAAPSVRALVGAAAARTPLVWDPHPRGAVPLPGSLLATPNESEARTFAALPADDGDGRARRLARAGRDAAALVARWQVRGVVVTLGGSGALLSYGEGAPVVVPAPRVASGDPCGAGDRLAAAAAVALGAGRLPTEAVQEAVAAASAYVAAGGPAVLGSRADGGPGEAPASVDALLAGVVARGGTVVATGGCFDLLHAGHVATLRAARDLGDCLVVCLNSDASVRRLKGPGRPLVPAADRARVLEALECVDAVVEFDEDTPVEVLRRIRPDVWAKGGDYAGREVPEAEVLAGWGGQVVALPYLDGRSTTRLVDTARLADNASLVDTAARGRATTPREPEKETNP